jgi:hypothetical protein
MLAMPECVKLVKMAAAISLLAVANGLSAEDPDLPDTARYREDRVLVKPIGNPELLAAVHARLGTRALQTRRL